MTIIAATQTRTAGATATKAKHEGAFRPLRSQIGWAGVFAARVEQ